MVAAWDASGRVHRLVFRNGRSFERSLAGLEATRAEALPESLTAELDGYFDGTLERFETEPALVGAPFQRIVWESLRAIPYGATASYGEIARRIGRPGASRAVGAANGANPVCLIVPCHRVIGSDGSLTGFGGGLRTKRALLALEMSRTPSMQGPQPALPFGDDT